MISCEISLFVTAANREGIFARNRTLVWRRSLGGTAGASVNSGEYSLIDRVVNQKAQKTLSTVLVYTK